VKIREWHEPVLAEPLDLEAVQPFGGQGLAPDRVSGYRIRAAANPAEPFNGKHSRTDGFIRDRRTRPEQGAAAQADGGFIVRPLVKYLKTRKSAPGKMHDAAFPFATRHLRPPPIEGLRP